MSVKLDLRNKLINGNFEYWQRGTSLAIPNSTAAYLADRWTTHRIGASWGYTAARSTDIPSGSSSLYSMQISTTTAAAMAVGDYAILVQAIEGNILRGFKNKKMVVSFWVKSTKTGIFCAQVCANSLPDNRRYLVEYTVNASNTWEKKTFRFTHDSSGTWDYATGTGLNLVFTIAAGDNLITTANSWQTTAGNAFKTSNQVNGMDNVANVFKIADAVMVEDNEGQTREPDFMYAGRDVFEELQLCQRYYSKSFPLSVAPGASYAGAISVIATPNAYVIANIAFPAMMRISPIVSLIACDTGVPGWTLNMTRPTAVIQTTAERGFSVYNPYSVSPGNGYFTSWTADAEL
jgi:hypothetical protein